MPSISYFRRIAVKVITIKKIGKKKSSNALLRFPEDLRWFTVDFPKTDFKLCKRFRAHPKIKKKKLPRKIPAYLLCTSTHFSSFIAQSNVTPSTSWWNDCFFIGLLLVFFLILQRPVSEFPTVCTWCMPAWNPWRSRLSFLIGMIHQTSSEYRKWFVHFIWLVVLWEL